MPIALDSMESIRPASDVFDAVSPEIAYGLVPQENSIFGPVTETYDTLRLPEVGQTKFVKGEVTIAVRHCLIVRRGVKREDITRILSHDQVRISV